MVENEIVKVIIKMFAINFFVFICFFKIYNILCSSNNRDDN